MLDYCFLGLNQKIYSGFKSEIHFIFQFGFELSWLLLFSFLQDSAVKTRVLNFFLSYLLLKIVGVSKPGFSIPSPNLNWIWKPEKKSISNTKRPFSGYFNRAINKHSTSQQYPIRIAIILEFYKSTILYRGVGSNQIMG